MIRRSRRAALLGIFALALVSANGTGVRTAAEPTSGPFMLTLSEGPPLPGGTARFFTLNNTATVVSSCAWTQPTAATRSCVAFPFPPGGHGYGLGAQSADGSKVILGDGTIVAWNGQVIGHTPGGSPTGVRETWAEDGQHLCAILGETGLPIIPVTAPAGPNAFTTTFPTSYVWLLTPNGSARRLAAVDVVSEHGGTFLPTCNLASHTAIVAASFVGNFIAPTVVDLSTGATHRVTLPDVFGVWRVIPSRDGSELALTLDALAAGSPPATVIIRTSDGAVIREFPDSGPLAFSWSGRYVIVQRPDDDGHTRFGTISSGLPIGIFAEEIATGRSVATLGVRTIAGPGSPIRFFSSDFPAVSEDGQPGSCLLDDRYSLNQDGGSAGVGELCMPWVPAR